MSWHLDAATATRYAGRTSDPAMAASVEAHLMACDQCRTMVNASFDDVVLAAVWADINDTLDAPRLGWVERALHAAGCSDTTSRIVAATTRARWAYLFVVAFNILVAIGSSRSGTPMPRFCCFWCLLRSVRWSPPPGRSDAGPTPATPCSERSRRRPCG
jgi:hypothetical protein